MHADDLLQGKTVEYNIVEHCNLRCSHCDHAAPLFDKTFIDPNEFHRDLTALVGVMRVGELKILGGEPLLHPRLLDFLEIGRAVGVAETLTVATNGLLLHRMDERFWRMIDRLWLSVYPGIAPKMRADEVRKKGAAFGVRVDVMTMDRFHRTLVNRRIKDEAFVQRIAVTCQLPVVNWCHTVRKGRYYRCSPSPYAKDRLALCGIDYDGADQDGVSLHGNPELFQQLRRYVESREPLPACHYCLGSSGPLVAHRQLSRNEVADATRVPDNVDALTAMVFPDGADRQCG